MSLSVKAKRALEIAVGEKPEGAEVSVMVERQAAVIAAIGATSNLVGVDGTGSNAAPLAGTESRLDAIEAKIDAVIAALKAASLMAS